MPPSACSKRPRRNSRRARERALLVPEQLGLEQVCSERGRVQRDERLGRARAVAMQRARHQFLACAGFTRDQHRHARTREPPDRAEHFLHRRRVPEHLGDAPRFGGGFHGVLLRRRPAHELDGLVDVERLGQVFECAALVRGHRAVEVRVRGHHDHRQFRPARAHVFEQFESALAGHADVGDQHVRLAASQCRHRAVCVLERDRRQARLLQGAFEHPADRGIVVDDPDFKRRLWVHWRRKAAGS